MAWELLKTDYVDAVFEGLRRYLVSENGDGSVSFHDVTNYTVKEGAFFGAKDANRINTAVNAIMAALENGTDLYEVFTQFFEYQKELFQEESDAKQDGFEAYITELRAYMDGKWDELKAEYTGDIQYFKDVQENAFNVWFQMVRDQLTNDVAGHLQLQIGNLEDLKTDAKDDLVSAINSLCLSYDETMELLLGVYTVSVSLSANDEVSVEGQTVTLLNVDTGKEVFKDYEEGGISFEVMGDTKYLLSVSNMEYYATPESVEIFITEGEGGEVQLEYVKRSLDSYSWAEIAEISESGKASEVFAIHDEKEIELSTSEKVVVEIVGFDHDTIRDGDNKMAGITFGMKDCLSDECWMNSQTVGTNQNGWSGSYMRNTKVSIDIFNRLPRELREVIKFAVKKTSMGSKRTEIVTTYDEAWLFSMVELGINIGQGSYDQEGYGYPAFTSNAERIKGKGHNGKSIIYFSRSPDQSSTSSFMCVTADGVSTSKDANLQQGIAIGFCV